MLIACTQRFTPYDFKRMHRRSYYPQNQQIVSTVTATFRVSSRPVTPTTIPGDADGAVVDSVNGSTYGHKPHDMDDMMDSQAIPMNDISNEKGIAC
jgi:serine/threonine kinase 32